LPKINVSTKIFIAVTLIFLIILWAGLWHFFYVERSNPDETQSILALEITGRKEKSLIEDKSILNIYYPQDMKLNVHKVEIKRIFDSLELTKAAINEFFANYTTINKTVLTSNVEVLGIYYGTDNLLYINLSREMTKNFHGDAIDEYMFLRSLYMTVGSHIEVQDIKLLVDNHEINSLAGHYDLTHPIKNLFVTE